MAHVGYIRVSSVDQNTARQLDGLVLDKVFEDKASGRDTNRPGWQACRSYLREGDVLHVHSIDRLSRSMRDLMLLVDELTKEGIAVQFEKERMTFSPDGEADPLSKFSFHMLAAFAEFERALNLERQREGIAKAKAAGKYKGRKPRATRELAAQARELLTAGHSKAEAARRLGVGKTTLYKALSLFPAGGS